MFVKNIDTSFDSEDLFKMFSKYGTVKSAKLSLVPGTHKSRGYGFVWFSTEEATHKAMDACKSNTAPF